MFEPTRIVAVSLAGLLLPPEAAAAQDVGRAPITVRHVAGSVHMLSAAGGNIGISVGPDGVFLVDYE